MDRETFNQQFSFLSPQVQEDMWTKYQLQQQSTADGMNPNYTNTNPNSFAPDTAMAGSFNTGYFNDPNQAMSAPSAAGQTAQAQAGGGIAKYIPYGSLALGAIQTVAGISAVSKASKLKQDQFALTGDMSRGVTEANAMRNQGFTGGERASYEQGLGSDATNSFNRAKSLGGGQMAGTMWSILNGQNVDGRNKLAVADAGIMRQNIDRSNALNLQGQTIQNMNTQQQNENVIRQKQAAAQLLQSGLGNIANPMNYLGGYGFGK